MKELQADIFDLWDEGKTICITTNGYIGKGNKAVMGRGVAKQALDRWPSIDANIANVLTSVGNVVMNVWEGVFMFPVKPSFGYCAIGKHNVVTHMKYKYIPGAFVPGWAMVADPKIIQRSLYELELMQLPEVYLPKPGCGAGGLDWNLVRPICAKYGDWLTVVDR